MKSKSMSGRKFLTIVSGLVFAYAVYEKILQPEAVSAIVTMVFVSYFSRKRKEGE